MISIENNEVVSIITEFLKDNMLIGVNWRIVDIFSVENSNDVLVDINYIMDKATVRTCRIIPKDLLISKLRDIKLELVGI